MGGRGQQSGFGNRIGDSRGVGDPTHLHIAPAGEFEAAGADAVAALSRAADAVRETLAEQG